MTLDADEFIRRFLIHVLPKGLHRIRHYGLFASAVKAENLAKMRDLLGVATPEPEEIGADEDEAVTTESTLPQPCPRCGHQMRIIETFAAGCQPRHAPNPKGSTAHDIVGRRQSIPRARSPHRNDGARLIAARSAPMETPDLPDPVLLTLSDAHSDRAVTARDSPFDHQRQLAAAKSP